jgi:hypothetical protein
MAEQGYITAVDMHAVTCGPCRQQPLLPTTAINHSATACSQGSPVPQHPLHVRRHHESDALPLLGAAWLHQCTADVQQAVVPVVDLRRQPGASSQRQPHTCPQLLGTAAMPSDCSRMGTWAGLRTALCMASSVDGVLQNAAIAGISLLQPALQAAVVGLTQQP